MPVSTKTKTYLDRLKKYYSKYDDKEWLQKLSEIEDDSNLSLELSALRQNERVQAIVKSCVNRYKQCLHKLTTPGELKTEEERVACFIGMDWACWFMNALGSNPKTLDKEIDEMVVAYMQKTGLDL